MINKKVSIQSKTIISALLVALLLSVSGLAFAQEGNKTDKRKTSINFEDELIQGEVKKPELLYLLQKKQFNFKRLIKLRDDFLPEMNRTAEEIQPSGRQN